MSGFAVAAIIEVGADNLIAGQFENAGHLAIATRRFPNITVEGFVLDQSVGSPGWGLVEVRPVEIGLTLCRRLEAAIQVVLCPSRMPAGLESESGGTQATAGKLSDLNFLTGIGDCFRGCRVSVDSV
jgi:hypothetical protein